MGPKEPRRTEALQEILRDASTATLGGNQSRAKGGADVPGQAKIEFWNCLWV